MTRTELLEKLINIDSSVSLIIEELNTISWDSDQELVRITKEHFINILKKYQDGTLNETEVEDWANAIEGREDIGINQTYKNLIVDVLHELANPSLVAPLTTERAKILTRRLYANNW